MEPLTIAGIVTILLTGALTKVGENALDGSLKRLSQLLQKNAPETWNKLISTTNNTEALPEVIEIMAETIKDDDEIKKLSEKIANDNQSKPEIKTFINQAEKSINIDQNIGTINISWLNSPDKDLVQKNTENLPRSGIPQFVGREKALEELHKQLQESKQVAISTLTGMGGIDKTELAWRYALADRKKESENRSYKSEICWVNVADKGNVGTQILNFAQKYLKITILEEGELEERVKHCWQFWGEEDTLIIFDDVREYKQIKDFLPPQQKEFKVIITTRKQRLAESIKVFALEVLDEQSALELIISFIDLSSI